MIFQMFFFSVLCISQLFPARFSKSRLYRWCYSFEIVHEKFVRNRNTENFVEGLLALDTWEEW